MRFSTRAERIEPFYVMEVAKAAQALARLDQEERAWNQKLDDYAAAKAQAHDPGQMQALRERLFTPQEQLRLEAALALRQSQH